MEIENIIEVADPVAFPREDHPAPNPVSQPNLGNCFLNLTWFDLSKIVLIIFGAIMIVVHVLVIQKKNQPQSPLCVANFYVALNGSAEYKSIAAAVNATTPSNPRRTCIVIKEGRYEESVTVPSEKINLAFLGDGMNKTILTSNHLLNRTSTGTLKIIGRGFLAMDLTILNTANPDQGEEAVALENWGDESIFYRCSFIGNSRTLNAAEGKQFYRANEIQGSTYFIYGGAKAVFQNCNIKTVQSGERDVHVVSGNTRSSPSQYSGFLFQLCEFAKAPVTTSVTALSIYLGAPITPYSKEIVVQSYLDSSVVGWKLNSSTLCPNTVFLAEYKNKGVGATNRSSSSCTLMINETIANQFSMTIFFNHSLEWIPSKIPYEPYV